MGRAGIIKLDNDDYVCEKCHAVVMALGQPFRPCGCVEVDWASERSGVSPKLKTATLAQSASQGQNKAIAALKLFVGNFPHRRGVYLHGVSGTGKTYLATAAANAVMKQYRASIAIWDMPSLIVRLKSAIDGNELGAEMDALLAEAAMVKLLVMDDFASERISEFAREYVGALVRKRDESGLPLIVTTNTNPNDLPGYVDGRIASRVLGLCDPVPVLGVDLRKTPTRAKPTTQTAALQ